MLVIERKRVKEITGAKSCSCCCYREPYFYDASYMGVYAGKTKDIDACAKICNSDPKIYAGFMGCEIERFPNCSVLTNEQLADKIAYHRWFFGNAAPEIDLNILRGK